MLEKEIPVTNPEYTLEQLDNELLLYHPTMTKAVYMNESASLVWQLCDGSRNVAEIANLLQESFPEAGDSILKDVNATLDNFLTHGAVKFK